jgi:hypothetical protein
VNVQPATTERRNQTTLITHEVYRNASPIKCDVSKLVLGIKITGDLASRLQPGRRFCIVDVASKQTGASNSSCMTSLLGVLLLTVGEQS